MNRREFVGVVGGVLGTVGLPSAPIPAVESSLEKLKRLVESSGGLVWAGSDWDTMSQGHRTLVGVCIRSAAYIQTDFVPLSAYLGGTPCGLIGACIEESAESILGVLARRGLI